MTKFRSPTEQPIQLALTSGHSMSISPEGTEVPLQFQSEAIDRGAVPVDGWNSSQALRILHNNRQMTLKEAVADIVSGRDRRDFRQDGSLNLQRLLERLDFPVMQSEADAMLVEVRAEALAAEGVTPS